mmetsp:Transcript_42844/g.130299  ORF Transcript_42844/g.130299 Transcript_42844/m.130299 type:complete len:315 (-) Transcript_42844:33-977(-)
MFLQEFVRDELHSAVRHEHESGYGALVQGEGSLLPHDGPRGVGHAPVRRLHIRPALGAAYAILVPFQRPLHLELHPRLDEPHGVRDEDHGRSRGARGGEVLHRTQRAMLVRASAIVVVAVAVPKVDFLVDVHVLRQVVGAGPRRIIRRSAPHPPSLPLLPPPFDPLPLDALVQEKVPSPTRGAPHQGGGQSLVQSPHSLVLDHPSHGTEERPPSSRRRFRSDRILVHLKSDLDEIERIQEGCGDGPSREACHEGGRGREGGGGGRRRRRGSRRGAAGRRVSPAAADSHRRRRRRHAFLFRRAHGRRSTIDTTDS